MQRVAPWVPQPFRTTTPFGGPMSTFIIHLLLPPLMAQTLRFIPARFVWAWVWVSVAIDLDYLGWILYDRGWIAVNFHRALFHNVFFPLVLGVVAYYAFQRYRREHPGPAWSSFTAYAQTWNGAGMLLAPYYFFSHILLDMSQGGVALLFPLSLFIRAFDFTAFYRFDILIDTSTHEPVVEGTADTSPGVVEVSEVYQWLSSEESAFLLLFASVLACGYLYHRLRRAEAPPVPPNQP